MNLMTRAFLSCKRNKMKTFALLLLLVILGSVLSVAITTNLAANATVRNLKANTHTVVVIQYDANQSWEIYQETGERVSHRIEPEVFHKIGTLPYVRSFDYSVSSRMFNPSLESYNPDVEGVNGQEFYGGPPELGNPFTIKGTHNPNIMEIEEGVIELVSGRVFCVEEIDSLSYVAVVSEAFANLNDLNVGSTFSMRSLIVDYSHSIEFGDIYTEENIIFEKSYDLEIVGLFRPSTIPTSGHPWADWEMLNHLYNRIYTPNNFAEMSLRNFFDGIVEHAPEWWVDEVPYFDEIMAYDNLFSLETLEYLPDFRAAVEDIIPEHFKVVDASDSLQGAFVALGSMTQLTFRALWFAMGATILIVTLLVMLFLRDRQKEMGIYLSLGERKEKVVLQILVEILVVAALAIMLALFIGNLIASNISHNMLVNDLTALQEADICPWGSLAQMGFRNDISVEAILESYNVSLNLRMVLSFFAIGALTTGLSTVIPVLYIVRMNPKKIMM